MRLIDTDELIERAYRERLDNRGLIAQMIESALTVDAEPVVRCKNCKHYYAWDAPLVGGFCFHDGMPMLNIEPMHYCSWGERREDADN